MKEREFNYMKQTIKCKEFPIDGKTDGYGRGLVVRIGKQSDAEQVTDEASGAKRWTAGTFFDMQINTYIKDEEYDELTTEKAEAIAKKLKLF